MSDIHIPVKSAFTNYDDAPSGVADLAGNLPATLDDGTEVEWYNPAVAEASAQRHTQQAAYERAHPIESGVTPQARLLRRLGVLAGLAMTVPATIEASGPQDGATFATLWAINLAVGIGQEIQFHLEARAREERASQSDPTHIELDTPVTRQLEVAPSTQ